MEDEIKFKIPTVESESRRQTNRKYYVKRVAKEAADSTLLGKRQVDELHEQLTLLKDENQTLQNSLDFSKSTVRQLEEQIVMQNSNNLPTPVVQSKVTKKHLSKTRRRTMRDQVIDMQFNMYASTESDYVTENGKPIGHTVRMNMDLKQTLVGKRLKYFIGENISAAEKTVRYHLRGRPSEYTLALPHDRFLDCEKVV